MKPFLFSCDAHIAEPADLFSKNMPEHLSQFVIHGEKDGDYRITRIGDQVILKVKANFHAHKTGQNDAAFSAQTEAAEDRHGRQGEFRERLCGRYAASRRTGP